MKIKIIVVLLTFLTGMGVTKFFTGAKTAYVDLPSLYSDFTLKKELEKKLENVTNARKTMLDSLELQLKVLSGTIDRLQEKDPVREMKIRDFETIRQEYMLKKKTFSEDNDRTTQQYDDQVWKQLNQYVKEYGKNQGYTFIFGADGSGVMMYGEDGNNITKQVAAYVNDRYKGKEL